MGSNVPHTVDLLLTGAPWLNVFTGELESSAVAVDGGRIVGCGDFPARATLDLTGTVLLPGFCDGHLHFESAMLSPAEFARSIVQHGTTTVVTDLHEIGNVLGMTGIRAILDAIPRDLLDLYLMVPSCVPATPLESAGAVLGPAEIRAMLAWPEALGLGEMMNFPGVLAGVPEVREKLAAAAGRPVDGHAPGLSGQDLMAYVAAGPNSDHECTALSEGAEKLGLGMWIMVREGSAAQNLAALAPLLRGPGGQRCLLVADDLCADDLVHKGHVDHLLRRAVAEGVSALDAVRAVTLNAANRFGLRHHGAIAPGFVADLVAVEDLEEFRVRSVLKSGGLVVAEGKVLATASLVSDLVPTPASPFHITEDVFRIVAPISQGEVTCRIIEAREGQITTGAALAVLPVRGGVIEADVSRDILKMAVVARHGSGTVGRGLVHGFGLRQGALASTVAHDSHNLVAVGCDERSLATAARVALAGGGGQVVAVGDQILAHLPLPIAGLLSDQPAAEVVHLTRALRNAAQGLGCPLSHPFMTLSFMALPVIPELKLTDQGLVDITRFSHVPLVVE